MKRFIIFLGALALICSSADARFFRRHRACHCQKVVAKCCGAVAPGGSDACPGGVCHRKK